MCICLVLILVGLVLLEICTSEDKDTKHDEMQPREVNYKKFIGERQYVSMIYSLITYIYICSNLIELIHS